MKYGTTTHKKRLRTLFSLTQSSANTSWAGFRPGLTASAEARFVLAGEAAIERHGLEPMARVVARTVSAVEPHRYGIGPVEAAARALARAGIGWDDVDVVELNEAFAAQSLACLACWPELDPGKVNPNGGAIAIGHPIGASGARILTSLVHELRRTGGRYGLATMCIGVGQGIAVLVERS